MMSARKSAPIRRTSTPNTRSPSQAQPPTAQTPLHQRKELPPRGVGLVTTRDVLVGQLILAEEPRIEITELVQKQKAAMMASKLSEEQKNHLHDYHGPQPSDFAPWTPSEDSDGECDGSALQEILNNNSFIVNPGKFGSGKVVLFNDISKINHSCLPTAARVWIPYPAPQPGPMQPVTGYMAVRARTFIPSGDEITIDYKAGPDWPDKTDRLSLLQPYGFICDCVLCNEYLCKDSDARREELQKYLDAQRDKVSDGSIPALIRVQIVQEYVDRVEAELGGTTENFRYGKTCRIMDDRLADA